MRDRVGNKISDEEVVRWDIPPETLKRILFTVIRTQDGGLSTPEGFSAGFIQLTVAIPINPGPHGGEPTLEDFLCVKNPNNERLLDQIAGSSFKQ